MAFSQVVPEKMRPDACVFDPATTVPEWEQCGGIGYTGLTECGKGFFCKAINDFYSQCQREMVDSKREYYAFAQCGGRLFANEPLPKTCLFRQQCVKKNDFYWQCVPCPAPVPSE
jgi:hypothetical protein